MIYALDSNAHREFCRPKAIPSKTYRAVGITESKTTLYGLNLGKKMWSSKLVRGKKRTFEAPMERILYSPNCLSGGKLQGYFESAELSPSWSPPPARLNDETQYAHCGR